MTFFNSAFLVLRQTAKHVAQIAPDLAKKRLLAPLGNENDMVFAVPFAVV